MAVLPNLQASGVQLEAGVGCVLRGGGPETVDHLLCHCSVAGTLWNRVLAREGIAWCMSRDIGSLVME